MLTVPVFVDRRPFSFPRLIRDAPPSVRLVYAGLHLGVGENATELTDGLGLPERTVRAAVRRLIADGLVERRPVLGDTRRNRLLAVGVQA